MALYFKQISSALLFSRRSFYVNVHRIIMFHGPIITRQDLEEAAKLHRRRQFEEARKKRIFDTKQRIFGIDSAYLNRQIYEHQERQSKELEIERRHDAELERQQLVLGHHELEQQKRRRMIESDVNYYRSNYQRKDQRREYDLNDPHTLRKARPARVSDNDINLGISSAQVFDGEDLNSQVRRRLQTEQQRAWLEQQIQERKQAKISKQQADNERAQEIEEHERCLKDMAESEQRMRAQIRESINDYNKHLANEKRFERERAKREKMEDDLAEIYNMLSSDILAEDPTVGQSCIDPNKRLPYMYCGMTPDEKLRFEFEQEQHKREKEARLQIAKSKEQVWEEYTLDCDRKLKLKELETQERERKVFDELVSYNRELAMKQREQHKQYEKDMKMNKNAIKDEFFLQFNTTSR